MKKTKVMIPALGFLALSTAASITGTVAWFSTNNKVSITGMNVKTSVSDNLYVAASTAGVNKLADSEFYSSVNQAVTGNMQPASSISGATGSFYTTNEALATGQHQGQGNYTAVAGDTITISAVDYKAYVDYVVELKAVNASASNKYVNLSKVNLLYAGAATNVNHAWRVAVFSQAQADPSVELAATAVNSAYAALGSASTILAKSDYAYFTTDQAVNGTAYNAKAAVSPSVNAAGWSSPAIAAGKTQYYKVTVRLWLEGEDTDCYTTKFANLTNFWSLDIDFTFDDSTTPAVAAIGSLANATNSLEGSTLTAALTVSGKTAASYQWYKVSTGAAIDSATNSTYTASATDDYYCIITTTDGNTYMTPVVHYTQA